MEPNDLVPPNPLPPKGDGGLLVAGGDGTPPPQGAGAFRRSRRGRGRLTLYLAG